MAKRITKENLKQGWRKQGTRFRLWLLGGLWTGLVLTIYTFSGNRYIFMPAGLSFNHAGLEKRCGNCHHAFYGVNDENCAQNCHSKEYNWNIPVEYRQKYASIPYPAEIHYHDGKFSKKDDCLSCHPAKCHPRDTMKQPTISSPDDKTPVAQVNIEQFKEASLYPDITTKIIDCPTPQRDNLVLPNPISDSTCNECHKGCKRSVRCYHCHREHSDGSLITVNNPSDIFMSLTAGKTSYMSPRGRLSKIEWNMDTVVNFEQSRGRMSHLNCMACHPRVLTRIPPTPEEIDRSIVSRSIFRHNSPGHKRYRKCTQCHTNGEFCAVEGIRENNIFRMEACTAKCHWKDECALCHRFHTPVNQTGEYVDWPWNISFKCFTLPRETAPPSFLYFMEPVTEEMSISTAEEEVTTPE